MSSALVATILVLGLGVIVVRRRSVAIALVGGQSLALGSARSIWPPCARASS